MHNEQSSMALTKILLRLEAIFGGALLLFLLFHIARLYPNAILYAPINDDAGYYISISKRLSEGLRIIQDVDVGYTPLAMMIMSWYDRIFFRGHAGFEHFMMLIVFFQIANAGWTTTILKLIGLRWIPALCCGALQLLMCYRFEGFWIFLEPFTIFFALSAFTILLIPKMPLQTRWLAIGSLTFLSYFSKQYGLASLGAFTLIATLDTEQGFEHSKTNRLIYLQLIAGVVAFVIGWATSPVVGIAILTIFTVMFHHFRYQSAQSRLMINRLICLYGGFIVTATVAFTIMAIFHDTSVLDFIKSTSPRGYIARGTGFDLDFFINFIFNYAPWLCLVPFTLFVARGYNLYYLVALLSLAGCFVMPLYVRNFGHYYGLVIPALILACGVIYHSLWQRLPLLAPIAFLLSFYTPWYIHKYEVDWSYKKVYKDGQFKIEKIIQPWIRGRTTLSLMHPAYDVLFDLKRIMNGRISYGFLINFDRDTIISYISENELLIIDKANSQYGIKVLKIISELEPYEDLLKSKGLTLEATINERFEIWSVAKKGATK